MKASTLLRLVREVADPRALLPAGGIILALNGTLRRRALLSLLVSQQEFLRCVRDGLARPGAAPDGQLKPRRRRSVRPRKPRVDAPLPAFVPPQLATLATAPPEGADWLHEIKYDGYRAIAAVAGDRCRLYTRSGQDWTDKFASIAGALARARTSAARCSTARSSRSTSEGRSRFQLLQPA